MTLRELIECWCISRWIKRLINEKNNNGTDSLNEKHNVVVAQLLEIDQVRKRNRAEVDNMMLDLLRSMNKRQMIDERGRAKAKSKYEEDHHDDSRQS